MKIDKDLLTKLAKPPVVLEEEIQEHPRRIVRTTLSMVFDEDEVGELLDEFVRPELADGFRDDQVEFRMSQAKEMFVARANDTQSTLELLEAIKAHVRRFTPTVKDENPAAKCGDPKLEAGEEG
jgi:hypothetical protein